jgi:anaerobic magnesium-protoporphyrin IX monomethyl ester cyclase
VAHMEYAKKEFGATHIVFLDDTSFPDVPRMRRLFELIVERELDVTLEFRGARVNEIMKMDDAFIDLMVRAGGRLLMVGGESGSDRMLKKLGKGITKNQILEVNRKLARHPDIAPMYSFFYGSPGETYEDVLESKEVILQIFKDNPQAYINVQGDWKPVPGTKTLETAERDFGYVPPSTLDEWSSTTSSAGRRPATRAFSSPSCACCLECTSLSCCSDCGITCINA